MNDIKFAELLKEALETEGLLSQAYTLFHDYSVLNQLAAISQLKAREIEFGPIATFKTWQKLERHVKKGERALMLCMPLTFKVEKGGEADEGSEPEMIRGFAWKRNWFALAQTEGKEYNKNDPIPNWSKGKALEQFGIDEGDFDKLDGNMQGFARPKSVHINKIAQHPIKTLFHEIAHVVLGHHTDKTIRRDLQEVEAESVAYIINSILNLPGQAESRGYIQHWLAGQVLPEKNAARIFSAANKILKAGEPQNESVK